MRKQFLLFTFSLLVLDGSAHPQTNDSRGVRLEAVAGTTHKTALAAGASRSFTLQLKPNEFAQVSILQQGIDLVTTIHDPSNKQIHKADWRWSGAETVSWLAGTPGLYRIQVSARRRNGAAGSFTLDLHDLRTATLADVKWTAAENAGTRIKEDMDAGVTLATLQTPIQDALAAWEKLNYEPGIAQALNTRGFTDQILGKPLPALETLQRALALRRALNDTAGQAETLNNIAAAESAAGNIRKARDGYYQALEFRREAGDLDGIAFTLSNIGYIHLVLGETDEAIAVLGDAIQAAIYVADGRIEAQARINLGATLAAVWETEDALGQFRNALNLVKGQPDRRAEAYVLANLGKLYSDLGDYSHALPNLERATALLGTIGDKRGEASVLSNIGSAHMFNGKPDLAIQSMERSLSTSREVKNRFAEAVTLQSLAQAYAVQGDYERALKSNLEALEISRSVGDPRGEAAGLRNLADLEISRREVEPAIEHLNEARKLFERIRDRNGEASTLFALARIARDSGNKTLALNHLEEALKLTESQRGKIISSRLRGSYFASKRQYYGFYIDLLMSSDSEPNQQQAAAALEATERARARLLLDTLPLSRISINAPAGRDLDNRKRVLYREINRIAQQLQIGTLNQADTAERNKRLDSLLFEVDDLQAQILAVDPRYQALVSPSLLRLAEIQEQLDEDTLLLEYSVGDTQSFLWAVTRSSIAAFSNLPSRSEIDPLVRSLYESMTARSNQPANESARQKTTRFDRAYSTYQKTAALLSEKLLGPVRDRLKVTRLVIVSDGSLHFLPFGALPDPGDPAASPLIVHHEVVNLPSMSVLAALRKERATRPKPARTLALIADPVYSTDDPRVPGAKAPINLDDQEALRGGMDLRRLIYSRQEAQAVLSLVPKSQSREVLGFAASVSAATDPSLAAFRIVHFGVHGMFDSVQPSLSSLVFSLVQPNGESTDGFLRLYQIYNLRLPVDLVVLGACETAMGSEIHGEGVESLARGFMYAGASRLIASLWQVDDESTAALMKSFYRIMLGDPKKTPAAAIRQAQLEIRNKSRWHEPYFWAPFVFLGEWRR
jgi:CHAT domain-containing protein/tetratricopeptide (TPR) repeat protein